MFSIFVVLKTRCVEEQELQEGIPERGKNYSESRSWKACEIPRYNSELMVAARYNYCIIFRLKYPESLP